MNILEEINKLIVESESVSLIVSGIRDKLVERIKTVVGGILITNNYGKYGINVYRTGFTETILEAETYIDCIVIQGKNIDCLKKYIKNETLPVNCFYVDRNTLKEGLRFIIYYICNEMVIPNGKKDVIYHETEHLYQHILKKKNDKDYNFFNRNKLYDIGFELMNSSSFYEQKIGILLYLSNFSEQDAFVQGLYGELRNSLDGYDLLGYEKTTTRNVLKNFRNALEVLKKDYVKKKETIDNICELNGINYNRLIKDSEFALKRFENKIGKVLSYCGFNIKEIVTKPLFKEIVEEISKDKDIKK